MAMRRRFLMAGALILPAGIFTPAFSAAIKTGAAEFIGSLGNQALQMIRSDMAPAEKMAVFHGLLDEDFDMPGIARFVLGPYGRLASPEERQEFMRLLADDLVRFYNRRFAQYRGETLEVTGSRPDPAGIMVTSEIIRPYGRPIAVDWQLGVENGLYKVSDVIIDGVSMAVSERAEFARQIQVNGGQVAGLLARMREQASNGMPASQSYPPVAPAGSPYPFAGAPYPPPGIPGHTLFARAAGTGDPLTTFTAGPRACSEYGAADRPRRQADGAGRPRNRRNCLRTR
jgi:phospholipid transport system substrate-binding protein